MEASEARCSILLTTLLKTKKRPPVLFAGHFLLLAFPLACLVFATLFATSLILPHAITHTAWFTLQRRSSAARFTCLLVSRRVASFVTNAFLHTLHQCLALGVLNGPQRQQKDKNQTRNCNGTQSTPLLLGDRTSSSSAWQLNKKPP